jgi:hypothetical protein
MHTKDGQTPPLVEKLVTSWRFYSFSQITHLIGQHFLGLATELPQGRRKSLSYYRSQAVPSKISSTYSLAPLPDQPPNPKNIVRAYIFEQLLEVLRSQLLPRWYHIFLGLGVDPVEGLMNMLKIFWKEQPESDNMIATYGGLGVTSTSN